MLEFNFIWIANGSIPWSFCCPACSNFLLDRQVGLATLVMRSTNIWKRSTQCAVSHYGVTSVFLQFAVPSRRSEALVESLFRPDPHRYSPLERNIAIRHAITATQVRHDAQVRAIIGEITGTTSRNRVGVGSLFTRRHFGAFLGLLA